MEWQQWLRQTYPEGFALHAARLLSNQQFALAEEWARLTPDYEQSLVAQLVVGESYFYRQGGMGDAERVFQSIYQQFGGAEAAYWYGRTLAYNGKPKQAIPVLTEAAQKAPKELVSWVLVELGSAYGQLGQCAEANGALDQALQRDASAENIARIDSARLALPQGCR